jgi:hypothetical protein
MRINIEVIPHEQQRYPTVGDYWMEDGVQQVRISGLPDWRYEIWLPCMKSLNSRLRGIAGSLKGLFLSSIWSLKSCANHGLGPGNRAILPTRHTLESIFLRPTSSGCWQGSSKLTGLSTSGTLTD